MTIGSFCSILGAVSIIVSVIIKKQVKSPKVCELTLANSTGGYGDVSIATQCNNKFMCVY